jgi:excisionase family DNA binding protein
MEAEVDQETKMTLSVEEAARRLGVGRNQAYEAVRAGSIPAIRVGKRWLVLSAGLNRLLQIEHA